jgi:hypothetical protein
VYEYKGNFIGLHEKDVLLPTKLQKQDYKIEQIADIFPKYYLLKINNFNKVAENTLDEWIYFLKNSEVKDEFVAKGLDKAKEKLRYENLSEEEKKMYNRSIENRRIEIAVEYTAEVEARFKAKMEVAKNAILEGANDVFISKITGLTLDQIQELRKEIE